MFIAFLSLISPLLSAVFAAVIQSKTSEMPTTSTCAREIPSAGQPTARHLAVELHPKYLPKDAEPSLALSCFCHGISARTAIIIGALPP